LLFELDARPVRAEYDRAAAEQNRAQAQLDQATASHERVKDLAAKAVVSSLEIVAANNKVAEAKATLSAAEAGVNRARLDVEATRITAPIAGRIGHIELDVGNVVGPNTKLATLVSLSPVYASFDIDEATFRSLQRHLQKVKNTKPIPVLMKLHGDAQPERQGVIESIDNSFDPKTGTVRARATFPNEKDEVLPGMFAQVQLRWGEPKEALLIPDDSIMVQAHLRFAYAITPEDVVERRFVTAGQLEPDGHRVILTGLTPKDRVAIGIKETGNWQPAGTRVRAKEAKANKPGGR
jgi:multidrug efflux system membrane fusion protein